MRINVNMQQCPICNCDVRENPRYPKYVCNACIDKYGAKTSVVEM